MKILNNLKNKYVKKNGVIMKRAPYKMLVVAEATEQGYKVMCHFLNFIKALSVEVDIIELQTHSDHGKAGVKAIFSHRPVSPFIRLNYRDLSTVIKLLDIVNEYNLVVLAGEVELNTLGINTTHELIEKINVPILVIPEECVDLTIKKIIVPTDYEFLSNKTNKHIRWIAKLFGLKIEIVHIYNHGEVSETFYNKKEKTFFKRMSYVLKEFKPAYKLIKSENIEETVVSYLNNQRKCITAIVRSKKNLLSTLFYKHISDKMEHRITSPYLICNGV